MNSSQLNTLTLLDQYTQIEGNQYLWCRSKHTRLVDKPIHDALRLVSECFRPISPIDNLFVLAGIMVLSYLSFAEKVSNLPCNGPRALSPRSTLFTPTTQQRELKSWHPFVSAALKLLKNLDKPKTTAALWVNHKRNMKWQKNLSPLLIYSFCWPLTTGNDPT